MAHNFSGFDNGQILSIKLYKSELLYDVYNETNTSGNAKFNGENSQFIYHMKASGNQGTVDKLLRSMYKSVETLKTFMQPYLLPPKNNLGENTIENSNILSDVSSDDDYVQIQFFVSKRLNNSMLESISQLSHRFVYLDMVVDWFRSTKPDEMNGYLSEMNTISGSLRACFFKVPPTRPTHSK